MPTQIVDVDGNVYNKVAHMEFIVQDYLGDGVFDMFDGHSIWLHANDFTNPTDRICLEPEVLSALNRFAERSATLMAELAAQQTKQA